MKHKYQSNLSRKLVASGLAAVFSAGAFSSYVGAMNEAVNEQPLIITEVLTKVQNKEETKVPTGSAKVTIVRKIYEFKNIPSDQISSDFNEYIKEELDREKNDKDKEKIVNDVVNILTLLDSFCAEGYSEAININFFLDNFMFTIEGLGRYFKLSELFKDKDEELKELIEGFPKTFDILYFATKDYLESNNGEDYDMLNLYTHLTKYMSYSEVFSKYFKTSHNKIKSAAEKYFETSYNEIKGAAGESFEDIEKLKKGLARSIM